MELKEVQKRMATLDALELVQSSHVEITIRIPTGAILSQDNCDIGENIGVVVEEELDLAYPDDKKPATEMKENVSIQLITNPE